MTAVPSDSRGSEHKKREKRDDKKGAGRRGHKPGEAREDGADLNQLVQSISSAAVSLARDLPKLIEVLGKGRAELRESVAEALQPVLKALQKLCDEDQSERVDSCEQIMECARHQFRFHPWHGISVGDHSPEIVRSFIELVPTDTIKYEVDKESGALKADRPQLYSNVCPANYGFIPQTYCGEEVAEVSRRRLKRKDIVGDGDPLDICVLSDHAIPHGDFILDAIPIGGFRMIDRNQADDKIIAIMKDDPAYGAIRDISEVPKPIIEKLRHYFLTYKDIPGINGQRKVEITHVYNRKEAHEIIRRSQRDYVTLMAEKSDRSKPL